MWFLISYTPPYTWCLCCVAKFATKLMQLAAFDEAKTCAVRKKIWNRPPRILTSIFTQPTQLKRWPIFAREALTASNSRGMGNCWDRKVERTYRTHFLPRTLPCCHVCYFLLVLVKVAVQLSCLLFSANSLHINTRCTTWLFQSKYRA